MPPSPPSRESASTFDPPGGSGPEREVHDDRQESGTPRGLLAVWSLAGVMALFLAAILRLGSRGVETLRNGLTPGEWMATVALGALFVLGEGWGALQRKWVPRLVRRADGLSGDSPLHHRLLAPLYGMSLVGAPGPTLARAWMGTAAVVAAVLLVRSLPEPWRGIIDLAVAGALAWGLGAIVIQARRAPR